MKFSDKNAIQANMAFSGICKPASMVISYIYVPIALNYLGVERYGVWSTILTILSWISYFDIGIGNGLRNRLTESLSRKDGQGKKMVSSAYAFTTVIMAAVAFLFGVGAYIVDWNRIFGAADLSENLTAVVVISVIFVASNFILSICKNVLYAWQRAADISIMELAIQVLNMCGILVARKLFYRSLFVMAVVYGMSMTIVNIVASLMVYRKNEEVRPTFSAIDMEVGRGLMSLGMRFFVIQVCALVLFTTDSLIISYLYGAADVTPYSTVNKVFIVITNVYGALLTPIWSAVAKAKAERRFHYLKKMIRKLHLLMVPFATGGILLIFLFRPLAKLWIGQELNYTSSLIVLGGCYCILSNWCNTYANISNGLELMKVSVPTAVIQAVINIPLSLFFAEVVGMQTAGVLTGTVLSMVVAAIVQPIAVHRYIAHFCDR